MHRLAATFGTHGLHTLAVLANPYGQNYEISQGRDRSLATKSDLRWYASAYHANYPLLIDKNFHAVNRYGAGSYPTIYVIDAAGKVAFAEQGQVPYKTLARKISSVLK